MSDNIVGRPILDGARAIMLPFDDVVPLGTSDIGKGFFKRLSDNKVVRTGGNKFAGVFTGIRLDGSSEFIVHGMLEVCVPAGYDAGSLQIKNGDHLTLQASGEFTKAVAGQLVIAVATADAGRDRNNRESVAVKLLDVGQFVETDPVAPMSAPEGKSGKSGKSNENGGV